MNEPSEGNDKVIWALVIVLTGLIGSLLYYFIRRPERIRRYGQ
ncbi:MAG: PLDc_N domain-containing protein [Pirellulales bacterium]|nr:PLDc_N domain-containing protein [Pirellulales bacterium]